MVPYHLCYFEHYLMMQRRLLLRLERMLHLFYRPESDNMLLRPVVERMQTRLL